MSDVSMSMIFLKEEDVPGAKLNKPPSKSNVSELKRWLECHGEKKTGLKDDLIKRVEGCIALGKKVDPKVDGGKWYNLKARGKALGLSTTSLQTMGSALVTPQTGWKKWPSRNIPQMFNYGHVYHYLVESISNIILDEKAGSCESSDEDFEDTVTEKPLKKGESLFKSEFIEDVHDNETVNEYILRAHVHHSMKNDLPLEVYITFSKATGFVKKA